MFYVADCAYVGEGNTFTLCVSVTGICELNKNRFALHMYRRVTEKKKKNPKKWLGGRAYTVVPQFTNSIL